MNTLFSSRDMVIGRSVRSAEVKQGEEGSPAAHKQMPKLSDKKLCADSECSHPILIARAIEDFYPQDCRFIPIRKGQVIYVYSMLKDRGNLFWAGSVQGTYYGEQEARLGHFPRSVVEETHALMPATEEVKTDDWDFYCN
ncbi:hypothetical protein GJAV_G00138080 [Gymnothorax javanicus]|nr:hypothetical protein GJAV_G00138080 [Gymnothorax javanicus]